MEPIIITVLLCAVALFMVIILTLATGMGRVQRISGFILVPAAMCGLFFYTIAFLSASSGWQDAGTSVLRGVYSTFLMFLGRNDAGVMNSLPWFVESAPAKAAFWLAHLGALFVSAATILSALGGKLLQTLRLIFTRSTSIYLIFGLHEQSVFLGRDISQRAKGKIVYIDPKPSHEYTEQVVSFGGIVHQSLYLENKQLDSRFMRLLGAKGRLKTLCFFALDGNEGVNIDIAGAAVKWCKREKIPRNYVHILLRSHGELDFSQLVLFMTEDGTVYNVDAFSEAELTSRLLIRESPPFKTISFGPDGKALEDFCALIMGFGNVGQHALRQIVMNGQFYGSRFSAVVVDRNAEHIAGQFERRYLGMLNAYDIRFHAVDTRSRAFYELLDELSPKIKYIVVSQGSDDANYEATADLERYYARIGRTEDERPAILVNVCNKRFVAATHKNIRFFDRRQLVYTADILLRSGLDDMAEAVNFSYAASSGEADSRAAWGRLDYFSRESSRASADFIPAMLRIAGLTMEQAFNAAVFNAKLTHESLLLETLAITEHLRWNAFHFAMGYTVMSLDEMRLRATRNIKSPQKDTTHLRHACLVDWNALDEVSAVMTEISGREINYKNMDRENVLQIPRTLSFLKRSK